MTRKEFQDRLASKFPKDLSDYDVEDLDKFLDAKQVPDEKLEFIYDEVCLTHKYRTFPPLARFEEAYNAVLKTGKLDSKNGFSDHGIDDGAGMGVEDIITRCRSLRTKQNTRELTGEEVDFVHAWDGLVYISDHLATTWRGESHRIESYLKTIKDQILRRETVHYSLLPGMQIHVDNKPRMDVADDPRRFENPIHNEQERGI